ncbi:hypothetical protein PSHT_01703 [Puccinia striiformis]|uniref:Tryptophan synthase beta chain-like PALP domain-containing protein n=1 Tax=Puccinia striiformis TaxID=27350 RepID=A0A2S4WK97_9BASI|nr:hypothetical protein PSHT_01703 [Puccinia striiformis]
MSTRSSSSVGLGHLAIGVIFAAGLGTILVEFLFRPFFKSRSHPVRPGKPTTKTEVANNLTHLIGNTPLLRINCLSDLTGVEILAKCEFLNPGGSIKDRIALQIISEAEKAGKITPYTTPRCRVFEGTSGSTGISLALVARALGYEAEIVLPDDTATEKSDLIEKMGGTIVKVRPVSISNRSHYVNVARDRARSFNEEGGQGLFVDQFENPLNWLTHYQTTGPEIWEQTQGKIDYFIAGAGTGGTIAGVGKFLKSKNHRVKNGVMFSKTEIEGKRRRHQMDTVVEGIGSNRLTGNLAQIIETIDDAITIYKEMSRLILKEEGIFIGSSSAVNLVASYKLAQNLKTSNSNDPVGVGEVKKPITLVTILCDSGQRHLSKFWNDRFLSQNGFLDSSSSSSSS